MNRYAVKRAATVPIVLALTTVAVLSPAPAIAQPPAGGLVPVTDAMLQDPAPGDWPMWRRTLDGWGFRCECGIKN